jgi:hypothetical protein
MAGNVQDSPAVRAKDRVFSGPFRSDFNPKPATAMAQHSEDIKRRCRAFVMPDDLPDHPIILFCLMCLE